MPDPEDDGRPDDRGVGDAFDAIVSGWDRDGPVPQWPADPDLPPPPPAAHRPATGPGEPIDEHFVPPEPPPLPRLGPPAVVGLGLILAGIVLVTTPGWLGVSSTYGLPLGLVVLAAGLGWLVLRLWPTPPEDSDDDGARL